MDLSNFKANQDTASKKARRRREALSAFPYAREAFLRCLFAYYSGECVILKTKGRMSRGPL
jgi:hypothetical protein